MGISVSGSFSNNRRFLKNIEQLNVASILDSAGAAGAAALASATPKDTGRAAASWDYYVESNGLDSRITWTNGDIENGFPVAIMLQYGHGIRGGGYVQGVDYINPALAPIFDAIAEEVWRAVTAS